MTQCLPFITPAQQTMSSYSASPANQCILPCQQANQFWLENYSPDPVSLTFSIHNGAKCTSVLPQTANSSTPLINVVDTSGGNLDVAINGQAATVLENIDIGQLDKPEDLKAATVIGTTRTVARESMPTPEEGIPFFNQGSHAEDLVSFLPEGISEQDTDIDMVCVLSAAEGEGALEKGNYQVDDLNGSSLRWLLISLAQNTFASVSNEAGNASLYLNQIRQQGGIDQMKAALKELIWNGRFTVKPIKSWGGKLAVIFKGSHRARSFLSAITYGINNNKLSYINSYAQIGNSMAQGNTAVAFTQAAKSTTKGSLIGFFVAAGFDVNDFIKDEDPEKNWGDLLGALGVTFVKVWIAGYVGVLAAAAVVALAAGSAPVLLVVGIGVAVSIGAGVLLDLLDDAVGFKAAAKKIGRSFAGAMNDAISASFAFVEAAITYAENTVQSWLDEAKEDLRRNDPLGHCALFCSNPLDQIRAWQIGLGGGY